MMKFRPRSFVFLATFLLLLLLSAAAAFVPSVKAKTLQGSTSYVTQAEQTAGKAPGDTIPPLPKPQIITTTSPIVVRENVIITGTNLLSGTGEGHQIRMYVPDKPLSHIVIPWNENSTWYNDKIIFVMPNGGNVVRGATYQLSIWNGKEQSNEVPVKVISGWESKMDAPAAAASGDVVTYTVAVTNVGEQMHLQLTNLYLDVTPFITESLKITYNAGEVRITGVAVAEVAAASDKELKEASVFKRIMWAADVLPGQTVTMTVSAQVVQVSEQRLYETTALWIFADLTGSGADLNVVPDDSEQTPIQQHYLPLIQR